MAALDFPSSPTLNQIYSANGKAWIWDGVVWNAYSGVGGNSITTSATPPLNPSNGDLWFNTENGLVYVYYVDANSQQWVAPDNSGGGNGKVAQVVVATTNTPATTTSIIPADDTIPQSGEGAEFLTVTITPTNASSMIVVEFDAWCSASTLLSVVLTLFRDSETDARQATIQTIPSANFACVARLKFVVTAGSTSAQTYRIRFGPSGTGTAVLLRSPAATFFSTSDNAFLTATEILP